MQSIRYSIVIPLYNEADSLKPLWQQLQAEMAHLDSTWETIFINDGSNDTSAVILQRLATKHAGIRIINFRKNQGKAAALQAGFYAAQGEIIITMDADLQDDPKEISNLVKKLDEGYDLVTGLKKNRRDPFHKTVPSYVFNSLTRHISGVPLRDINSGLKAYRKPVTQEIAIYGELYRFIPILAVTHGFKVTEIPVNHRPRQYGKSKYGVTRFLRGILDLCTIVFLTRFLKRPLHLFGSWGLFFLTSGLIICGYLVTIHFGMHATIGRRPLLFFGILFIIAGLQLISTGLIAELITYYMQRMQRQQTYAIQHELLHPATTQVTSHRNVTTKNA